MSSRKELVTTTILFILWSFLGQEMVRGARRISTTVPSSSSNAPVSTSNNRTPSAIAISVNASNTVRPRSKVPLTKCEFECIKYHADETLHQLFWGNDSADREELLDCIQLKCSTTSRRLYYDDPINPKTPHKCLVPIMELLCVHDAHKAAAKLILVSDHFDLEAARAEEEIEETEDDAETETGSENYDDYKESKPINVGEIENEYRPEQDYNYNNGDKHNGGYEEYNPEYIYPAVTAGDEHEIYRDHPLFNHNDKKIYLNDGGLENGREENPLVPFMFRPPVRHHHKTTHHHHHKNIVNPELFPLLPLERN